MADSNVAITAGSGTNIDTRTAPDGDHRQVVVIGSPTTADVAQVNASGALVVQGLQSSVTTLNVTTSSSTTGTLSCVNYNVATVTIAGTHAGINLTFEISLDGGTTWVPVSGAQLDAAQIAYGTTGVVTTNASRGWDIALGAADSFRVRSTAFTSGTGVVKVAFQTMPYEPAPTVGIAGITSVNMVGSISVPPATPSPITLSSTATAFTGVARATVATLFKLIAVNNHASNIAYLKLYNKASAPTLASDVPILTVPLPAAGVVVNIDFGVIGYRFVTGIAYAVTGGIADTDTTAVALAQVKVVGSYL